jgi:hypothetical protein
MAEDNTIQADVLDAAVEALTDGAEKAWQPPHKRVAALLDRLMVGIHPTRRGEVAELIGVAHPRTIEMIARGDESGLTKELGQMTYVIRFGGFSNAKAEPSERDRWLPVMLRFRWEGREIDTVFEHYGVLKAGQRIERVNWWECVIDGRTWSRQEIRQYGRPVTFTNESGWLEGGFHRPIPTRQEIEQQAEKDAEVAIMLKRVMASR